MAPVNSHSYHTASNPSTSPHWVSPTPSLGNPFSFDSTYSHTSYVSRYASPQSPYQYPDALNHPDLRHKDTAHDRVARSTNNDTHVKRGNGASDKALLLLQETVGVDVVCTAAPIDIDERNPNEFDYDVMSDPGQYQKSSTTAPNNSNPSSKDDSIDTKCSKNGFDVVRERGANLKALALLEQTVGYDISDVAKATSIYMHKPTLKTAAEESYSVRQQLKAQYKAKKRAEKELEEQQKLEEEERFEARNGVVSSSNAVLSSEDTSSKQIRAKMIAEHKAKKKLEKYAGRASESSRTLTDITDRAIECTIASEAETTEKPIEVPKINHSARSTIIATVPDEELNSKQIRAKMVAEYKAKKKLDKTVGYSVTEKESLAETSRVVLKCSSANDPETITGMKCDIDIERENIAKKKALLLLNDRPGLMA
jgi:hypothetical protein